MRSSTGKVSSAASDVYNSQFCVADVPVTGGASVAVNVGAGGEGRFHPWHPSYPTAIQPYFPGDAPTIFPLSIATPDNPAGRN